MSEYVVHCWDVRFLYSQCDEEVYFIMSVKKRCTYSDFIEGETTTSTNLAVVLVGLTTNDGAESTKRTRSRGLSLLEWVKQETRLGKEGAQEECDHRGIVGERSVTLELSAWSYLSYEAETIWFSGLWMNYHYLSYNTTYVATVVAAAIDALSYLG